MLKSASDQLCYVQAVSPLIGKQHAVQGIGIICVTWSVCMYVCEPTLSLQVGAEFLALHYPLKLIYIPSPTWANHNKIFPLAGIQIRNYRYYKPSTRGLDYEVRVSQIYLSHQAPGMCLLPSKAARPEESSHALPVGASTCCTACQQTCTANMYICAFQTTCVASSLSEPS